jgi:uncharacterized protein YciI
MKHFILEGRHLAPFEKFAHLEPLHHEFLQKGYDNGSFLFSGPQVPPHGGFLAARAESVEYLNALLAEEPFVKGGFMKFTNVKQFHPVHHQSCLNAWMGGTAEAPLKILSNSQTHAGEHGSTLGWKHFLLEGEHIVPFEHLDSGLIATHRDFLKQRCGDRQLLLSGPTDTAKESLLVTRAGSLEELYQMLEGEPLLKEKVMKLTRIREFVALQYQPFLKDWFGGEVAVASKKASSR